MKCIQCDREIVDPARFCSWCGELLDKNDALPVETLELIFLRADLSGFTKMSEAMIAEDVMNFLNEIFGVFSKIIESYKGVIYQVIGDEVVGIFGFPKGSGFAPHMAVLAADDMLKQLNEINERGYLKNPIGLKIGMTMEQASIINLSGNLRNAMVITKGFTKCQILQKNAADKTVLICDNLYQATKAFFDLKEIGEFVQDSLSVKAYEYKLKHK